jgi:peptide chain release factor subunit 1
VTTTLNEEAIRALAGYSPGDRPVVTLYLDVDGKRWPKYQDCEARAERLVREALERTGDNAHNAHNAAADDLRRVETFVRGGVDRSETRGIAVFSSGDGFFKVFELPVSVRDQLVVNKTPHLHQLEAVLATHQRYAVLLTDRQRTRMFVFEMGRLLDRSERFDALPRHDDDAGQKDRRHDRHKLEAAAHQHLKNAAAVAFDVFQSQPFDHLVIAAADDITRELEADLHPYLRERIAARIHCPVNASDADIKAALAEVEDEVERRHEKEIVDRLRDGAGSGNGAVVGLPDVLAALSDKRVDTLVVSEGFEEVGFLCGACHRLAARGPACPSCGAAMEREDDIVERAIEDAMLQSATVKVCISNADLDVLGRIGALLRF